MLHKSVRHADALHLGRIAVVGHELQDGAAHATLAHPVFHGQDAPEFPSGSQVLIKKINERAFIDWGRTYVLDTCNGTVIKKLMPSDSGDSALVKCVSINPAYPPFEVNLHDVYGIYRVMLVMAIK